MLTAGDLNADPAVVPCPGLALAYTFAEGRRPDAFTWGLHFSVALIRWLLPRLVLSRIGGLLLIFQYLLASALVGGRLRSLAPLFPCPCGLLAGLTLLIGPPLGCPGCLGL